MFVIYKVIVDGGVKFERVAEVRTLQEANEFLEKHKNDDDRYTVTME